MFHQPQNNSRDGDICIYVREMHPEELVNTATTFEHFQLTITYI